MNKVYFGDCRESLRLMAADGVTAQTCVTSPPYFGLRDYGVDGQIGQEETPEEFIAALVEVFGCVRDVLADDGTLWINIGDSYASSGGMSQPDRSHSGNLRNKRGGQGSANSRGGFVRPKTSHGEVKQKDLIGIPWMLAFALRADGWYLRQDIIWHKPNPMPESVTDRCTKAHEYIFLLSKSPRYFYDADAIAVPIADSSVARLTQSNLENQSGSDRVPGKTNGNMKAVGPRFGGNKYGDDASTQHKTKSGNEWTGADKANKRSVWTVPTMPYKGAHFATFPTALIEPCIMAGSKPGQIILDPFFGSGTTGEVALNLGRQYIGCELNKDYEALQSQRTRQSGFVLEVAA